MNKLLIFLSLLLVQGCLISQKKLDALDADNNYYSPAQTIKCMQMPSPQRPTPINKKGETRESYDQNDCYDDLLLKDQRELEFSFGKSKIALENKKEVEKLPDAKKDSIDDIDIDAIEEKVIKKTKKD